MKNHRIIVLLVLFLHAGVSQGQIFDTNLAVKLQQRLDSVRNVFQIKGISACVYIPDQGYWDGVSGVSWSNSFINKDMEFGIGSNTKLFTAVCLLKLMESDTSLKLDDPVSKWVPAINNVNPGITIRQLLNHTSGVEDYTNFPGYADSVMSNPWRVFQPEEFLSYIGTPVFAPGAGSYYSNTNYLLAGLIFQAASNQSLPLYLRTRILNPLQMDSTFFDVFEPVNGTIAHPWQNGTDINEIPRISLNSAAWSAGAMYSTAREMARWYKELLIDKTVLNQSSFNELTDFEPIGNYGLGIGKQNFNGRIVWGHGGDIRGYRSRIVMDTATRSIVVILTNSNPLDVNSVTALMLKVITTYFASAVDDLNQDGPQIRIYPNPTSGEISMKNLKTKVSYQILNVAGQLQGSGETTGRIDLSSFPEGLYFLRIKTPKTVTMIKVRKVLQSP